jgi:hypothetical protein
LSKVVTAGTTSPSRNGIKGTVIGVLAARSSSLMDFSFSMRSTTEAFSRPSSFMIIPYAISVTERGRGLSMSGVPDIEIARLKSGTLEKS